MWGHGYPSLAHLPPVDIVATQGLEMLYPPARAGKDNPGIGHRWAHRAHTASHKDPYLCLAPCLSWVARLAEGSHVHR